MYKKYNQSNEYNKSSQSCQSYKCDCDTGSNAYCTCTRATSGTSSDRGTSATSGHTSFPCAHCSDYDPSTTTAKCAITSNRECNTANDYIEREYAEYLSATNPSRENSCSGVWVSDEPRNFKQADADSGDSIERRIGIPAGVTV